MHEASEGERWDHPRKKTPSGGSLRPPIESTRSLPSSPIDSTKPEKKPIKVDESALDALLGKYDKEPATPKDTPRDRPNEKGQPFDIIEITELQHRPPAPDKRSAKLLTDTQAISDKLVELGRLDELDVREMDSVSADLHGLFSASRDLTASYNNDTRQVVEHVISRLVGEFDYLSTTASIAHRLEEFDNQRQSVPSPSLFDGIGRSVLAFTTGAIFAGALAGPLIAVGLHQAVIPKVIEGILSGGMGGAAGIAFEALTPDRSDAKADAKRDSEVKVMRAQIADLEEEVRRLRRIRDDPGTK